MRRNVRKGQRFIVLLLLWHELAKVTGGNSLAQHEVFCRSSPQAGELVAQFYLYNAMGRDLGACVPAIGDTSLRASKPRVAVSFPKVPMFSVVMASRHGVVASMPCTVLST